MKKQIGIILIIGILMISTIGLSGCFESKEKEIRGKVINSIPLPTIWNHPPMFRLEFDSGQLIVIDRGLSLVILDKEGIFAFKEDINFNDIWILYDVAYI